MFDSASRSELTCPRVAAVPASVRGDSEMRAAFAEAGGATHLVRLFERGALRLRQPRTVGPREAVLVNTGGGITGGDRIALDLRIGPGADVVVTSQAAEKIYRSDGPAARIEVRASVEAGARLDWLPQETILFDGAAIERLLDVDLHPTAMVTVLECLVLGRSAHDERLQAARWRDRWRIRRDGQLVLAEDVRLGGDIDALLRRPAIGSGARMLATLVHVAVDAEARLPAVRVALATATSICAASAWNGILVARFAAAEPQAVRSDIVRAAIAVTGRPMPRAWTI